jgi:hypothetical protein
LLKIGNELLKIVTIFLGAKSSSNRWIPFNIAQEFLSKLPVIKSTFGSQIVVSGLYNKRGDFFGDFEKWILVIFDSENL